MSTTVATTHPSPLGPVLLLAGPDGLRGLYLRPQGTVPHPADDDAPPFADAREQLDAYFAGDLRDFDLPLAPAGTPFQQRVWAALREIPYGETRSYGEVARAIGAPGAARAVGLANGRNPISIVVPCHRVIGAGGALTGYGGGIERKRALLELETGSSGLLGSSALGKAA